MNRSDMPITINPKLEARLRERAEADGLSVEDHVERLLKAEQSAEDELQALALEGLNSGGSLELDAASWKDKHDRLDECFQSLSSAKTLTLEQSLKNH